MNRIPLAVMIFSFAALAAPARGAGPLPENIWQNPGYEQPLKAGVERPDCALDATVAHSGKQSLHLSVVPGTTPTWLTKTNYRNLCGTWNALEAGQTYLIRFWVKVKASRGGSSFVLTAEQSKSAVQWITNRPTVTVTQDWTQYSVVICTGAAAGGDGKAAVVVWFCLGGAPGGEAWIDDVELYQVPVFYQSSFETPAVAAGAPEGWTASGAGATWADKTGSPGDRSLALSLTMDGQPSPSWESDFIPVPENDLRISCRMKGAFRFSPDPTYNGNLTVTVYDAQKRPLRSYPDFLSVWRGYVSSLDNSLAITTADQWNYLTHGERFPDGTAFLKLHFRFRHGALDTPTTRGEVWLDDVSIARNLYDDPQSRNARWPVYDNANLRLYSPVFMNVFQSTEPLQFDVVIVQTPEQLAQNPEARLEYTVYDAYHVVMEHRSLPLTDLKVLPAETFAKGSSFAAAYAHATRKSFTLSPALSAEVGRFFYLDARVTDGKNTIGKGYTNFMVVTPAAAVSPERAEQSKFSSGYLYDEHTPQPRSWGKSRPSLRSMMGLHWLRVYHINEWAAAQPKADEPIEWENLSYDRLPAAGIVKPGVNNLTYVAFNAMLERAVPAWVPQDPTNTVQPYNPEIYGKFVYDVVSHYKDYNKVWEVCFSEPPLEGDAGEKFFRWARAGYAAAKRADPTALVVGAAATGLSPERIDRFIQLGYLDCTDALDLHMYTYGGAMEVETVLDYMNEQMRKLGKVRPIWSFESGSWHRDQDILCQNMVKLHTICFACGMVNLSWHFFGSPEWNREASMWNFYWGFREPWLSSSIGAGPAPEAYYIPMEKVATYYNVIRNLDYVTPRNRFWYDDTTRVYAFDRAGERVFVLWEPTQPTVGRSLAINATWPVTVTDAYGRRVDLTPGPYGQVAFPASALARMVNVEGQPGRPLGKAFDSANFGKNQDDITFRAGPLHFDYAAASGDTPATVTVQVTNTFAQGFHGTVQLQLDDTWTIAPRKVRVDLAPGKSMTARFTLKPNGDKMPGRYAARLFLRDDQGVLPAFSEVHFELGR